jgi:uncharacterized FlgJ-related protein
MRKTWLLVALIATFSKSLSAANAQLVRNYIAQFSQIAVYESVRSGIPASIILGQAILESQFGTGRLAQLGNNHFGIKWTSAKDGEYILLKDDDYDAHGNLIQSRFIKYKSVEESYVHHTDFLMTRSNYKRLFDLESTDYRSWAKGLSTCRYATDPQYATKLITIIETYNLQQFDTPSGLVLVEDDFKKENYRSTEANQADQKVSTDEDFLFEIDAKATSTNYASATKAAPTKLKTQNYNNKSTNNQLYEVTTDDDSPRVTHHKQATAKSPKRQTRSAGR